MTPLPAMNAPAWSSRREFTREVERPDEEMNLARAALLVAREEYVQLPVERYLLRLDLLAEETRDRLGVESVPPVVLSEAIRHLFVARKLRGNREHYHDPRNSFLNDVLDRGLGIPLTLGIVLLEVGWRLGLPLEGVNFPGHFLVRYRGGAKQFLIDPFHGGMIRSRKEVEQILVKHQGSAGAARRPPAQDGVEARHGRAAAPQPEGDLPQGRGRRARAGRRGADPGRVADGPPPDPRPGLTFWPAWAGTKRR